MPNPLTPFAAVTPETQPITKLIVAVHGIGDQFRYATIQAAARQIAHYCGVSMPFPLGGFHPELGDPEPLRFDAPAPHLKDFGGVGFTEVFWADLHQEAQKTGDTIEESKAWAHSMVDRMKGFDLSAAGAESGPASTAVNYELTSTVVQEMIDTIAVLENLCFIAARAGVMHFQLRQLLDDYLGAVQLVAEFLDYRGRIVGRFYEIMRAMAAAHSSVTGIYLITHSEGTVVSFYGLLAALAGLSESHHSIPPVPPGSDRAWVEKVRGYMTFGSPIDKHLVMWPTMWKQFHEKPGAAPARMPQPITWWNYYDHGDPVGFKLDITRTWLIDHAWVAEDKARRKKDGTPVPAAHAQQPFFDFPEAHDIGFTRYPVPGKAHIDYWNDAAVFGHFIGTVIAPAPDPPPVPETKPWAWFVSLVVPYLLCFLLLCGGIYVLEKNLHPFLARPAAVEVARAQAAPPPPLEQAAPRAVPEEKEFWFVTRTILGIAALLGGITVMSRIPRLVRPGVWWALAAAILALGCAAFAWVVPEQMQLRLNEAFEWGPFKFGNSAVIALAVAIALISAVVSRLWPRYGMKPLMILALLATLRLGAVRIAGVDEPLWPVVLSGAAFLYLWWLCALIFDLTFV